MSKQKKEAGKISFIVQFPETAAVRRAAELHIAVRGNTDSVGKKNIIQRGRRDILGKMNHILLRTFHTFSRFRNGDFELA